MIPEQDGCNDIYHTHTHVMARLQGSQEIPHYTVAGVLLFGLCYLLALVGGQIENLFGVPRLQQMPRAGCRESSHAYKRKS